jgi:hypothetical protein
MNTNPRFCLVGSTTIESENIRRGTYSPKRTDSIGTLIRGFFYHSTIWCHLVSFAIFTIHPVAQSAGEKYSNQGHAVYAELTKHLIAKSICKDFTDCSNKLQIYGEHGNQINFNMYGQATKTYANAVIEYLTNNGVSTSGGVPIRLEVYELPKKSHMGFNSIFNPAKPIITLELSK